MKFLQKLTLAITLACSASHISYTYDRAAFSQEVKDLRNFTHITSNTDLISLINAKLESDNTSNEDIANMRMIIENNMLTTPEKENSLLNLFSLEQHAKERFLCSLIVAYFALPLTTILLVALKKGGF